MLKSLNKGGTMHNIIFIVIVAACLAGCTQKEEIVLMQEFEKHKTYHKHLSKTEKVQLYNSAGETKALLVATYLFTQVSYKKDEREEVFIVGISAEDGTKDGFMKSDYVLTLNGRPPKNIQKISYKEAKMKDISFVTEWGEYYVMAFPHVESKSFDLVFESKDYLKGVLHFAKAAKYVLEQTKQ